jgi:DNA-binding transcriptional MerR regulator
MAQDPQPDLYTTGDLARLTGNTLRTVRYYEELGLLTPVPRNSGEHRLFTKTDLERLRTITDLRAVGLSLEEISEMLRMRVHAPEGPALADKARKLMDEQLGVVQERMATLARVQAELMAARDLLSKCCVCPRLGDASACATCDHARAAMPQSLISLLLRQDTTS